MFNENQNLNDKKNTTYRDIEGVGSFIEFLKAKGCIAGGINITLRHIKIFLNWLYEKERMLPHRIRFSFVENNDQEFERYFSEAELLFKTSGTLPQNIKDKLERCRIIIEELIMLGSYQRLNSLILKKQIWQQ